MNEITQILAKPLPLGLMVVFFLVALAVFSLSLARVEARHRAALLHYHRELSATSLRSGHTWAGSQPGVAMASTGSSGWLGWLLAVASVAAVGVALVWSQAPSAPALVVPDLARLPVVTPDSAPAVAVKTPALTAEIVAPRARVKQAALVPRSPSDRRGQVDDAAGQAPALRGPGRARARMDEDADVERLLAWERKRAAQRRRLRNGKQGSGMADSRTARPSPASGSRSRAPAATPEPAPAPQERAPRTASPVKEAPAVQDEIAEIQDTLLPPPKPRKPRRRLKLDQSGDPLGNT